MSISFRSSAIVYYGPHSCENCGEKIVKAGREFGGTVFSQPEGHIYPNTEWRPHFCDPMVVRKRVSASDSNSVVHDWPHANPWPIGEENFIILGEYVDDPRHSPKGMPADLYQQKLQRLEHVLVVSCNQTFYDTIEAAWAGAAERRGKNYPTWHINLLEYGPNTVFTSELLDSLPECPDQTGTEKPKTLTPSTDLFNLGPARF